MSPLSAGRALPWVLRLVGLGLFIWLIRRIDLEHGFAILAAVRGPWVLGALLLSLAATFAKSLRWREVLRAAEIETSVAEAVRYTWVGSSLGAVTPGRVGELARVAYLAGRGTPALPALQSVVVDRLLDLVNVLLFSLWGLCVWTTLSGGSGLTAWLVVAVGLAVLVGLFFSQGIIEAAVRRTALTLGSRLPAPRDLLGSARYARFGAGALGRALALSALFYLLLVGRVYVLSRAVGRSPDPVAFSGLVTLSFAIMSLPISVMDIGTRDFSFVYLFSFLGFAPAESLVVSTLMLLIVCLQTAVGLGLWLHRPPGLVRAARSGHSAPGEPSLRA